MRSRSLGLLSSTRVIASWVLGQRLREKGTWLGALVCALPTLPLFLSRSSGGASLEEAYPMFSVVMVVLAAFTSTRNIAEEIQDGTASYLWPRPFPRIAIYLGKLIPSWLTVALPLALALSLAVLILGPSDPPPLVYVLASVGIGTLVCCAAASTIGAMVPKSSLAVAIAIFLVDLALGTMPFAGAKLSITGHTRVLAQVDFKTSVFESVVWLIAMGVLWIALGMFRTHTVQPAAQTK